MILNSRKSADTPSIRDCLQCLEDLADEVWRDGYPGLQDACLLLLDVFRERSEQGEAVVADILNVFDQWIRLVEDYRREPVSATGEIINFLIQPGLQVSLSKDELDMLADQLSLSAIIPESVCDNFALEEGDAPNADNLKRSRQKSIADYEAEIWQAADLAANDGFFGLQEACLLLAVALNSQSHSVETGLSSELSIMLETWPETIEAYKQNPGTVARQIIEILRHSCFQIPLSEEEFEMLETSLLESSGLVIEPAFLEANRFEPEVSGPLDRHQAVEVDSDSGSTRGPTGQAREILDMLVMQTELVARILDGLSITDRDLAREGLREVEIGLERLGAAGETAGYRALTPICTRLNANIRILIGNIGEFSSGSLNLLIEGLDLIRNYLFDQGSIIAGQQLVFLLNDEGWPLPLALTDASDILARIRENDPADLEGNEEQPRKATAAAEDVSLDLPDDVNRELLEILLQELPLQTQQFSEAVQHLQDGGCAEDVLVAQRIAHTLKGSANTVGINGVAFLTHQLEDILTACSKQGRLPQGQLAYVLLNAADCLEGMSEALMGLGEPPSDARSVLQEVLDWANRIDREGVPESDAVKEQIEDFVADGVSRSEDRAAAAPAQSNMARISAELLESLFRLSGETIILNTQALESMRRVRIQLDSMQNQFSLLQQLGNELERLIDLRDLSGLGLGASGAGFDQLEMDQYNELHTVSRRMAESAIDAREFSLDAVKELSNMNEVLDFQQRMVIDAQEIIMQTKLVPISTITARIQRTLRQTCRLTGKKCNLEISGESILIDGDTLGSLVNPLMHILRNAIDHGIESEDERLAVGKSAEGLINLEFDREGNNIILRCRDDGRGLDYSAIRRAAVTKGYIHPGQDVSEEELKRFILRSNFSSRTVITQTSGRGVGMDVVHSQIQEMGGTLTLHSVTGRGLKVEIRTPLPLSMTYALITNVGHYRVAIANKGISQIVFSEDGVISHRDGVAGFQLEDGVLIDDGGSGGFYPMVRLSDLLHVHDKRQHAHANGSILLVRNEDRTFAVFMDRIVDSLNVVIKGMGEYIGKIPGYIGATILGDGAVIPVLDIPELLRAPTKFSAGENVVTIGESENPDANLPIVLVVDDSLSQRRALEQLLTDAGFAVRAARDGIEAVEMLAKFKPDFVLTDLEMPRMNGIELVAHIRNQERLMKVPIIMITSRTTQKHRDMAEEAGVDFYFIKPVRDIELVMKINDLLERVVVEN